MADATDPNTEDNPLLPKVEPALDPNTDKFGPEDVDVPAPKIELELDCDPKTPAVVDDVAAVVTVVLDPNTD